MTREGTDEPAGDWPVVEIWSCARDTLVYEFPSGTDLRDAK